MNLGLEWLAKHQDEDGRWETSFGRVCPWLFGDDFERGDTFRWSSTAP